MRLRKVKHAGQTLAAHPEFMVADPLAGHWRERFGQVAPIHLEIGIGKGKFLFETAKRHPEINYVGIEKFDSVLVRALERLLLDPLPNVKLLHMDAEALPAVFAPGEIDGLYLNFSDPWPKHHHAKRRLTSPLFLARYQAILKPGAPIRFKTDNYGFFEYTLMTLVAQDRKIERISLDLHGEIDIDNVETEFETRFVQQGQPIYYIAFHN